MRSSKVCAKALSKGAAVSRGVKRSWKTTRPSEGIVADRRADRAYVAVPGEDRVAVIDTKTMTLWRQLNLRASLRHQWSKIENHHTRPYRGELKIQSYWLYPPGRNR